MSIELESDTAINYAMQQNDVPVVKLLRINNLTDEPLSGLTVCITTQPEFTAPEEIALSSLAPGASINLGTIDLHPSHDYLANLAETVIGSITVTVGQGEESLASYQQRIEVLAYDEWTGLNSPPELLAAFVMPNSRAVEHILGDASEILMEWSGSSSLDGYMSGNLEKAFQMVGAIYEAVRRRKISYIVAPASFEPVGQKIRTPDRLLESCLGNCLDLTVLMAACIEQAGLNPILIVHEGHAYCGAWLEEHFFPDAVVYDVVTVRKRVDLNDLCVFEATLLTSREPAPFKRAVAHGRKLLDDADAFHCAVDVRRARMGGVTPLPLRLPDGRPEQNEPYSGASPVDGYEEVPSLAPVNIAGEDLPEEGASSRLDRWKRRLLDLSLRNRLINFKSSKTTVHILYHDLGGLLNALSEDHGLKIYPLPAEMLANRGRDPRVHYQRTGREISTDVLKDELKANRLRCDLGEEELSKRLTQIFRKSRSSIEEGGVNTLFLAMGFLKWCEKETSTREYLAPILLIPLTLTRLSMKDGYTVHMSDEDPLLNTTLLEMLEQEFDIAVNNMGAVMAEDELDVDGVLNAFRKAVKHVPRWEVVEDAHMGHFSFAKLLMWRDLQVRSDDLQRNSVVAHLMNTPNEPFMDQGPFPSSDRLDDTYLPQDTFCPMSADSSQLSAVYASGEGKSFVLHGPPGTGKSQTITNIIAHNLALGRTVLFVSEKKAALDVVYGRLKDCGLGPFCLELHSNKSNKVEFLQQLGKSLSIYEESDPEVWNAESRRLHRLRAELNEYVTALHRRRGSGDSVFRAVSELIRLHDHRYIGLQLLDSGPIDVMRKDTLFNQADRLMTAAANIVHPKENMWASTDYPDWTNSLTNRLIDVLDRGMSSCQQLGEATADVSGHFKLPSEGWSRDEHKVVMDICLDLRDLIPDVPSSTMLSDLDDPKEKEVRSWLAVVMERDALREKVLKLFLPRILTVDLPALRADLNDAGENWLTAGAVSRLPGGKRSDWAAMMETQVLAPLGELEQLGPEADRRLADLLAALGLDLGTAKVKHLDMYAELAELLHSLPVLPVTALLASRDWDADRIVAAEAIRRGRERDRLSGVLSPRYTDELLALDLEAIRRELNTSRGKWFLPRAMGYRKAKKAVMGVSRGSVPPIDGLLSDLGMALALKAENAALDKHTSKVMAWLGPYWKGGQVDWDELENAVSHCDKLRTVIYRVCRVTDKEPDRIRAHFADLLSVESDRFTPDGDLWRKARVASSSIRDARDRMVKASMVLDEASMVRLEERTVVDAVAEIEDWKHHCSWLTALRDVAPNGLPSYAELFPLIDDAIRLNELNADLASIAPSASVLLGKEWNGGEVDQDLVVKAMESCRTLRHDARRIAQDEKTFEALVHHWASFVGGPLEAVRMWGAPLDEYLRSYDELVRSLRAIEEVIMKDAVAAWGNPGQANFVQRVGEIIAVLHENVPEFKTWCHWRALRKDAIGAGMGPLVEAFESGDVEATDLGDVFRKSLYQEWAEKEISSDGALNNFFSPEFEKKIQNFRELDDQFQKLTVDEIRAKLSSRLPSTTGYENGDSELGILKREIQKQRRHMPVRLLIKRIPNLLPRLKPCFLMSPISVTQYLDASHPPFDLVVFDEASQMPVWDAVGAIARGTSLIVVGDPKQLPPTNFFNKMESEEADGDEDTVEDMASILDDCIAARLPEQYLRWHYRSRHESLIAFSNHCYYDDGLITFPSPQEMTAVKLHLVNGVYGRSSSRTNRKEAEAVVAEVVRRLKDPELSRFSIGVVTFSIAQQSLIEDLLDEAKSGDPELEALLECAVEPIFVKNLENVQGDERDVILLSVCYGPDQAGKISMNFGPLNKDNGERRLNVAITRARWEVVLFSSITADQINLSRTSSRGVADLKSFLDYADRGLRALAEVTTVDESAECESYFEEEVSKALRTEGYEIHNQVGASGYRIDMAIVDPDNPGRYLLGIECDGANYHSSKNARDRDKLRESVLNDLGWKLHRIWSTDWWHSPKQEMEKIAIAVETAKKQRTMPKIAPPIAAPSPEGEEPEDEALEFPIIDRHAGTAPEEYQLYRNNRVNHVHCSNEMERKKADLIDLVEVEGPVLLSVAARRIAPYWDVGRCTEQFVRHVRYVLARTTVTVTNDDSSEVLWPSDVQPGSYRGFRAPGDDPQSKRKIEEIPMVELANGVTSVLEHQISMPADALVTETARLFGFQKAGSRVYSRISEAIDEMIANNRIREESGMLVYMEQ